MCKIHARLGKSQLYNLHISYIKGPDVLFLKYNVVIDRQELKPMSNRVKQAGAVLGQAQIKLELELGFSALKIWCIRLINKTYYCLD